MDSSKEELVALIKETVAGMKAEAENACGGEEGEEARNACGDGETEKPVENAEVKEEIKEEVREETAEGSSEEEIKEEVKEEVEEEAGEPEEKEEEVIKIEALSQRPTAFGAVKDSEDYMKLHGKEFFDYLAKHPELRG